VDFAVERLRADAALGLKLVARRPADVRREQAD
jgi:hypothetical protein